MANLADVGAEIDGTTLHLFFDRHDMADHDLDATGHARLDPGWAEFPVLGVK